MANAAPANGSRSTHGRVTRLQSSPACDSIRRHTIVIPANGHRVGKQFIARHMVLTQGIPSDCNDENESVQRLLLRNMESTDSALHGKSLTFCPVGSSLAALINRTQR